MCYSRNIRNLSAGIGTGIKVDAATYYGNGLYCNKEKCWVDWNQAKGEIGKIIVNGWVNHGPGYYNGFY